MEIICPPTLTQSLKNKYLLLDTNIFRDAASKPTVFGNFFNELKRNEITLVTIDVVKYELLKGSASAIKYKEKEKLISDIVDAVLPMSPTIGPLIYKLIQEYGIDGTALSLADLVLGAMLMQYKENLYLMTKDTSDFMQNIFDLSFIINATHKKGIHTYGVYQYTR